MSDGDGSRFVVHNTISGGQVSFGDGNTFTQNVHGVSEAQLRESLADIRQQLDQLADAGPQQQVLILAEQGLRARDKNRLLEALSGLNAMVTAGTGLATAVENAVQLAQHIHL